MQSHLINMNEIIFYTHFSPTKAIMTASAAGKDDRLIVSAWNWVVSLHYNACVLSLQHCMKDNGFDCTMPQANLLLKVTQESTQQKINLLFLFTVCLTPADYYSLEELQRAHFTAYSLSTTRIQEYFGNGSVKQASRFKNIAHQCFQKALKLREIHKQSHSQCLFLTAGREISPQASWQNPSRVKIGGQRQISSDVVTRSICVKRGFIGNGGGTRS